MPFSHASKDRLTEHDLGRFSSNTLFDRIGRAVCAARCLPRKELYEAWEVARRARRRFRGGRVVDMAGGHGLLAHLMLLLDATSPAALVVDLAIPPSAKHLSQSLGDAWPDLPGKVTFLAQSLSEVSLDRADIVVSSHACGALTDRVLDAAMAVGARVAVLPCCHNLRESPAGPITGWVDAALAIDIARAARLEDAGYTVWTQTIPSEITPKNRLLLGQPRP